MPVSKQLADAFVDGFDPRIPEITLPEHYRPAQAAIFDPGPTARKHVIVAGTKVGKTYGLARRFLRNAHYHGGVRWWVAPTLDMAERGVDIIVHDFCRNLLRRSHWSWAPSKHTLTLKKSGGIIRFRSADEPDRLQGDNCEEIAVDEAGRIRTRDALSNLETMVTYTDGHIWLISNPARRNWFYDEAEAAEMFGVTGAGTRPTLRYHHAPTAIEDELGRVVASTSPYIDVDKLVEKKQTVPKIVWRKYYLARFPREGTGVFPQLYGASLQKGPPMTEREWRAEPHRDHEYQVGWDPARKEDDSVALAICRNCVSVEGWLDMDRTPWPVQRQRIMAFATHFRMAKILPESNGQFGDQNSEALAEKYEGAVEAVVMSGPTKNAMIERTADAIDRGRVRYPNCAKFLKQMDEFEVRETQSGYYVYHKPNGGRDDYVSAFVLAMKNLWGGTGEDWTDPWSEADEVGSPTESFREDVLAWRM